MPPRPLSTEALEDRNYLSAGVITGTPGDDVWITWDIGTSVAALSTMQNGVAQSEFIVFSNIDQINFDGLEGNDSIAHFSSKPIFADLGAGDDSFSAADGAEGSDSFVNGGAGNDSIQAGSGNSILLGGDGIDTIIAGDGDDFVATGFSSMTEFSLAIWTSSQITLGQKLIALHQQVDVHDDGDPDPAVDAGLGTDILYTDTTRRVTINTVATGTIYDVQTAAEFNTALLTATAGDEIRLAPGDYTISAAIGIDIPGVTIRGAGPELTTLRSGSIVIDNMRDYDTTTIRDLKFDITNMTRVVYLDSQGYHVFRGGRFLIDNVEVTGQGRSNHPAFMFKAGPPTGEITQAQVINSYFHDLPGDGISTGGSSLNAVDPQTFLEVIDTVGERSGPRENNQLLTAHTGYHMTVIGGRYADAVSNVIASDNATLINLYFVTIENGNRRGGVLVQRTDSIIFGSFFTGALQLRIYGRLEESVVTPRIHPFQTWTVEAMPGATITKNFFLNDPVTNNIAVRLREDVELVDNVFVNWNDREWEIVAGTTGQLIEGNIIL